MAMKDEGNLALTSKLSMAESDPVSENGTDAAMASKESQDDGKTIEFDAVKAAIEKKDGKAALDALKGAKSDAIAQVAKDSKLMAIIKGFDEKYRDLSYDILYQSVEDTNVLIDLVFERFGVPLVTDKKQNHATKDEFSAYQQSAEKKAHDWTPKGVRSLYSAYLKIPQSHLDQIRAVYTAQTATDRFGGEAYSWYRSDGAKGSYGVYELHYNEENPDVPIAYDAWSTTTSKDSDTSNGFAKLQEVAAHELGHVVDYNSSPQYSETDEFRACSKWKEHPANSEELIKYFLSDCFEKEDTAYPVNFQKEEKEVAKDVAKEVINKNALTEADTEGIVEDKIKAHKKDLKDHPETMSEDEAKFKKDADVVTENNIEQSQYINGDIKEYDYSALTAENKNSIPIIKELLLRHTELVNQARRGLKKNKAYYSGEPFNKLIRQIHQDDHGTWFSYDTKVAETKKISAYQYVNPYEEFAEAFSCYYNSNDEADRKSRMPEALKKWFDEHNFNITRSRDKYNS